MEEFDIKVDYKGQTHEFHVVGHEEDPAIYHIYQGDIALGTLTNECDDRGDYWCSKEITDEDFLDKIGERIEKYHR